MKEYVPNTRKEVATLIGATFRGILIVLGMVFNGWVITLFWGWFVTPTFDGIHSFPLIPAIGIAALAKCLTYQSLPEDRQEYTLGRMIANMITEPILYPAMTLFFGWVVHLFM